jgi:CO/xanthine dehydrogenase FAD-binding subunit
LDYLVPPDLAAALEMTAAGIPALAGGTDFYPSLVGRPSPPSVVDIAALDELRGIVETSGGHRIGALTRWADVASASLPPRFDGLRAAAGEVGSVQVQNAGTVGGNLCNASPAADGVPPLLTLDASVELTAPAGVRVLPLGEFLTGYRRTALEPGELLTAVLVPRSDADAARSAFLKLGLRRYLVISVVMVAAAVEVGGDGRVERAAVAVGACSPVAQRLTSLESDLAGREADDLAAVVTAGHLRTLRPIDDVRGSGAYRLDAALTLVRRALAACTSEGPTS